MILIGSSWIIGHSKGSRTGASLSGCCQFRSISKNAPFPQSESMIYILVFFIAGGRGTGTGGRAAGAEVIEV